MRSERRDKGTRLMTPRDRWILRWIADQYAVRFDLLQALISRDPCTRNPAFQPGPQGVSASNVGQILRRWERSPGWVEYRRIYVDSPGWISVTPYCMQLLDLPYSRHVLKESTLHHLHGINRVRFDVERRHPAYRWVSERALRIRIARQFPARGSETGHVPDAVIWTPEQRRIAVEVELNPKPENEVDDILTQLLIGEEAYQTVWYFVSQDQWTQTQAGRSVEAARQRLPEELRSRLQIIDLEQLS